MEYNKLNRFVERNHIEVSKLLGKEVSSVNFLIQEVKKSNNKSKKLYDATRDMSKIIDFYDEKTKINLNREDYSKGCLDQLTKIFPEEKINDYKDIFKVIINRSLEFDEGNWNKFYDTILESTETQPGDKIDQNVIYSLDFEDLTPKKLVAIYQRNLNDEMVEGGTFSFQSDTQEMMGIVNEFVISKGKKETKKYLSQGKNKEIKVTELLKEVNAASLVEPFAFQDDKPTFKRAASGQFDGFILQKDSAKVILATKNENTNIENDSILRHFITAMVIKQKIDETIPSNKTIKSKQKAWYDHYTSKENIKSYTREFLDSKRQMKKESDTKLSLTDYYIDEYFYVQMKETLEAAKYQRKTEIKINTNDFEGNRILDFDVNLTLFGRGKIASKSGAVKLDILDAEKKLELMKVVVENQKKYEEVLREKAKNKVINPKFREQIKLDAKKEEMVINANHLSIKSLVSELNQDTKKGLIELGIFDESDSFDELGYDDMEKIKAKAKGLNLELIYFGSVSDKKSSLKNEYDRDFTGKSYTNKEYRYGLNLMAYANILSSAQKDNFKITTDASLSFVEAVDLRAVTKKKGGKFDLDLEKINKEGFMKDIVYITYKAMYENRLIEKDSIDFFENFLNTTNVILNDFMQDYQVDIEDNPKSKIENSFNLAMKNQTGRDEDFDLIKTVKSLKECLKIQSKKIKNVSLVDALNQRLNEIIKISDEPEMKDILKNYPIGENKKNKSSRKERRTFR